MRRFVNGLIVAAVVILAFILQCTLVVRIRIGEVSPNILIVVIASLSFLLGENAGIFIGLLGGLLLDIFFGPLLGFHAMILALIGYLAGKFQRILYVEDLLFPAVLIAVSDLLYTFLCYVFLFLIRNRLFFADFFLRFCLPEMVCTAVAAAVLYPLLRLLYDKVLHERSSDVHEF